jgi:hypothetical protein
VTDGFRVDGVVWEEELVVVVDERVVMCGLCAFCWGLDMD